MLTREHIEEIRTRVHVTGLDWYVSRRDAMALLGHIDDLERRVKVLEYAVDRASRSARDVVDALALEDL